MKTESQAILQAAIDSEIRLKKDLNGATIYREKLFNKYCCDKYSVKGGDIVYGQDGERQIKLEAFIMWSENLNSRPDIKGFPLLPFGFSKKPKIYRQDEWMTEAEKNKEVNGNTRRT